mmetsp:Transcript_16034/g.36639  ORF Transcript_16034/g.36639 Transcript_16034/m.36639 type:complete len:212 (+) Transcript_16034:362-997(+)
MLVAPVLFFCLISSFAFSRLSSIFTHSSCPYLLACISAVSFCLFGSVASPFRFRSRSRQAACPLRAASSSAVSPCSLTKLTLQPASSSSSVILASPTELACISAVSLSCPSCWSSWSSAWLPRYPRNFARLIALSRTSSRVFLFSLAAFLASLYSIQSLPLSRFHTWKIEMEPMVSLVTPAFITQYLSLFLAISCMLDVSLICTRCRWLSL